MAQGRQGQEEVGPRRPPAPPRPLALLPAAPRRAPARCPACAKLETLRLSSLIVLVSALLALRLWPATAAAAGPAGGLDVRAKYEEQLVSAALGRRGLQLDPAPDGKVIEQVVIDASPIILPGDFPLSRYLPWTFLNRFHMRTRDYILAQELLFQVGQRYRSDLVEESGRNLRGMFILSVARLVAARGSAPDRVVVVVVTKDQWSLRLNSNFNLDGGAGTFRIDSLSFQFTEHNLLGRNKAATFNFAFNPGRYTVGVSYADPRIWSSRHQLALTANLYLNRQTSALEGGLLSLTAGRPLFSLRTRWAWEGNFVFQQSKVRDFNGGDLRQLCYEGQPALRFETAQMPCKDGAERVPNLYGRRYIGASLALSRSFGVLHKVNLSAGVQVYSVQNYLTEDQPADLSREARQAFSARLPRSEEAAGPYLSLSAFRAEFVRLKNIETFALTEDFRVGPSLDVTLRWASSAFFLPSNFVELSASYGHLFLIGDDLLSFSASGAMRIQKDVYPGSQLVNQVVGATLRNVSPRFGPFRLHVAGRLRLRSHDLDNGFYTLGSDSGLRGFAPRELSGRSLYAVNAELRSIALNLWTLHVGGVLFYDGGDTPDRLQDGAWRQDVGVGLRVLFPQFNRGVLRLDLGFPLEGPSAGAYAPRFSAEFGQAF